MNWPALIAIGLGAIAFLVVRRRVSHWIVNGWLEGTISNRKAAMLFVLTYLAPTLIITAVAVINNPESAPIILLIALLIGAPILALGGGLMDYAAHHGVKERILRDRAARVTDEIRQRGKADVS